MKALSATLNVCLRIAGLLCLFCLALLLLEARNTVKDLGTLSRSANSSIAEVSSHVADSSARLNGPDGLLANANWTVKHLDQTVLQFKADERTAARKINGNGKNEDGLLTQTYKDLHDIHRILAEAGIEQKGYYAQLKADSHNLLVESAGTVKDFRGTIALLNQDMKELADLIGDPDIKKAIGNLDASSASIAGILLDVQGKIHQETHPSKKKRLLNALLTSLKMAYYLSQLR